jgi:hydroxypyruvate isomerase
MSTYQQSIAWWCLTPHLLSPQQLVSAATESGYAAVELLPEEHWPLAKAHGLAIASINGHASIIDGPQPSRQPRPHCARAYDQHRQS